MKRFIIYQENGGFWNVSDVDSDWNIRRAFFFYTKKDTLKMLKDEAKKAFNVKKASFVLY